MAGGLEQVNIKGTTEDVFNFCTTPENWPKVFSITRWVWRLHCKQKSGPLAVGDIVEEHVKLLGMPMTFEWTCTASNPEKGLFELRGVVTNWLMVFLGGGYTVISYSITPIPGESSQSSEQGYGGSKETIIETIIPEKAGKVYKTRFIRYFTYLQYGLIMKILQALFINTILQKDFVQTLKNIKARVDNPQDYIKANEEFDKTQKIVMAKVAKDKGYTPGEHIIIEVGSSDHKDCDHPNE